MCRHAGFWLGGSWAAGTHSWLGACGGGESCSLRSALLCCVFSLSVSLLFLFPLFAVLLNCSYPDPPVFSLFLFILLCTPVGGGATTWPQLNYNDLLPEVYLALTKWEFKNILSHLMFICTLHSDLLGKVTCSYFFIYNTIYNYPFLKWRMQWPHYITCYSYKPTLSSNRQVTLAATATTQVTTGDIFRGTQMYSH